MTVVDPLAAVALFVAPRIGVAATLAIMIVDVVHNLLVVGAVHGGRADLFVVLQIVFLILVVVTARPAWGPGPRTRLR